MIKQKQTKLTHMNIKIEQSIKKQAKVCAIDLGITLREYVKQAIEEKIEVNTGDYKQK